MNLPKENLIQSEKYEIIHFASEEEPFYVLNKSAGLPSAPLKEGDYSLVSLMTARFPELKQVKGRKECEYGLLHRLDTATNGLLLMASTQEFYDYMMTEQKEGRFYKSYAAICDLVLNINSLTEGFPENEFLNQVSDKKITEQSSYTVSSKFRYFGLHNSQVRPVTEKCGKAALKKAGEKIYSTEIKIENKIDDEKYSVICKISEGFKHQVRCHLAWMGLPVQGDCLYNPKEFEQENMELKFSAVKIEFKWNEKNLSFSL